MNAGVFIVTTSTTLDGQKLSRKEPPRLQEILVVFA
jgi:hypothetical protein